MASFLQSKSAVDIGKLFLRLALGGLLIFHGIAKLGHGVAWMAGPLGQVGLPGFIAYGAYVGEFVAPILVIIGFLTRPAALIIAFDLFMAIFLVGRERIFTVGQSGGWAIELEAFYILTGLALFFLGAGKYSVSRGRTAWD
jgi:putative oxidoreductase